ncbi:hypothetical protein [Asaia sp. VD9]|uniref:hypothetical protein n=1 Tax=Asaia sp. VD9 TaxID=3081235 RepID=UPI003015B200
MNRLEKLVISLNYFCIFLIFLVIFFLSYGIVVTSDYAFSDDYALLFDASVRNLTAASTMLAQGGRPLYAIFNYIFLLTPNLTDLGWIRLGSILGIASFSTLLYRQIRTHIDIPADMAAIAAILCGLAPAFQVYSAWTIDAPFPWAACLSGISLMILARTDRKPLRRLISSYLVLTTSMMIYQPAAMVYWVFAAVVFWDQRDRSAVITLYAQSLIVMFSALATDFLASRIIPIILFNNPPPLERAGVTHDVFGKLYWFLHEVLPNALRLPSIGDSYIVSFSCFALITAGLIFKFHKNPSKICLYATLIPLSYAPNLIAKENWGSYRSQAALGALLTLLFFLTGYYLASLTKARLLIRNAAILALVYFSFLAHRNIDRLFVKPQVKELALVEKYLSDEPHLLENIQTAQSVYFIPSHWENALVTPIRYDEFGLPSSAQPWAPVGMVWSILHSSGYPTPPGLLNFTVGPKTRAPLSKDIAVVDLDMAIQTKFR